MLMPVECYEWDEEEEDYVFKELDINPNHIETSEPYDLFGDHIYVTFVSGIALILAYNRDEFREMVRQFELKTLLS